MRRSSIVVLLLLCLLGAASVLLGLQRRSIGGRQVIARAIEAHGGEAALRQALAGTLSGTGLKYGPDGFPRPFKWEESFQRPDRLRVTIRGPGPEGSFTQVYLLPADEWWRKTGAGSFERQKVVKRSVEPIHAPWLRLLQIRNDRLPVTEVGELTLAGKKAVGIEVRSPSWGKVIFYFDEDTGRLVQLSKTITDADNADDPEAVIVIAKQFTHYRDFDGVMLPETIVELHDGRRDRELTVNSARFVKRLPPGLFDKP